MTLNRLAFLKSHTHTHKMQPSHADFSSVLFLPSPPESSGCDMMEMSHLPQASWVTQPRELAPGRWVHIRLLPASLLWALEAPVCGGHRAGLWGDRLSPGPLDAALIYRPLPSPSRRRWWTTLWGPFPTSQTLGTSSCWWPAGACHAPTPRRTWKPRTRPRMGKGSTRWSATSSSLRT